MSEVILMQNDIPMLQEIRKTTQMGCFGIQTVMDETMHRSFRGALQSQLKEYEKIFNEADRLIKEKGAQGKNISPFAKIGSAMSSKMKIRTSSEPTAKIAELMLHGNTKGMIKSMHNIRTMGVLDPKVSSLSNRLLQTEQSNIDQMKQFL